MGVVHSAMSPPFQTDMVKAPLLKWMPASSTKGNITSIGEAIAGPRAVAYRRLTSFSVVALCSGVLYFAYRLLHIILHSHATSLTAFLISCIFLGVELAFAGESPTISRTHLLTASSITDVYGPIVLDNAWSISAAKGLEVGRR